MKTISKIEYVGINKIKPHAQNPRIIKDGKFKQLVQSIKELPDMLEMRPIIVNEDYVILGGNMRWKACKEAGLKEVPIMIARWSEKQQKEFTIKDNVSFGEWDWDMLANQWEQDNLLEWGLDFPHFNTEHEVEAKGRMLATLDEKMDTYLNASIKQVVLYYDFQEYEKIIEMMTKVAQENNLEDNSSVVQYLLEKHAF